MARGKRKELHPADLFRKVQRKKDIKKCKTVRDHVRDVSLLKKAPENLLEELDKLKRSVAESSNSESAVARQKKLQKAYDEVHKRETDRKRMLDADHATVKGLSRIVRRGRDKGDPQDEDDEAVEDDDLDEATTRLTTDSGSESESGTGSGDSDSDNSDSETDRDKSVSTMKPIAVNVSNDSAVPAVSSDHPNQGQSAMPPGLPIPPGLRHPPGVVLPSVPAISSSIGSANSGTGGTELTPQQASMLAAASIAATMQGISQKPAALVAGASVTPSVLMALPPPPGLALPGGTRTDSSVFTQPLMAPPPPQYSAQAAFIHPSRLSNIIMAPGPPQIQMGTVARHPILIPSGGLMSSGPAPLGPLAAGLRQTVQGTMPTSGLAIPSAAFMGSMSTVSQPVGHVLPVPLGLRPLHMGTTSMVAGPTSLPSAPIGPAQLQQQPSRQFISFPSGAPPQYYMPMPANMMPPGFHGPPGMMPPRMLAPAPGPPGLQQPMPPGITNSTNAGVSNRPILHANCSMGVTHSEIPGHAPQTREQPQHRGRPPTSVDPFSIDFETDYLSTSAAAPHSHGARPLTLTPQQQQARQAQWHQQQSSVSAAPQLTITSRASTTAVPATASVSAKSAVMSFVPTALLIKRTQPVKAKPKPRAIIGTVVPSVAQPKSVSVSAAYDDFMKELEGMN